MDVVAEALVQDGFEDGVLAVGEPECGYSEQEWNEQESQAPERKGEKQNGDLEDREEHQPGPEKHGG